MFLQIICYVVTSHRILVHIMGIKDDYQKATDLWQTSKWFSQPVSELKIYENLLDINEVYE